MTDPSPSAASPPAPVDPHLRRATTFVLCTPLLVAAATYALHRASVPMLPAVVLALVAVACVTAVAIITGHALENPGVWRPLAVDDPEIPAPVELELGMVADELRALGFGEWGVVTKPTGNGAVYAISGVHPETATRGVAVVGWTPGRPLRRGTVLLTTAMAGGPPVTTSWNADPVFPLPPGAVLLPTTRSPDRLHRVHQYRVRRDGRAVGERSEGALPEVMEQRDQRMIDLLLASGWAVRRNDGRAAYSLRGALSFLAGQLTPWRWVRMARLKARERRLLREAGA